MMKVLADKKIIGGLVLLIGSGVVVATLSSDGFRHMMEKVLYQIERVLADAGVGDPPGNTGDQTLAPGGPQAVSEHERAAIQRAVDSYIESRTENGVYSVYDSTAGEMVKMRLKNVHGPIVSDGHVITACATFEDEQGRPIDLDVSVVREGPGYRATQAVLHLVDGVDRR